MSGVILNEGGGLSLVGGGGIYSLAPGAPVSSFSTTFTIENTAAATSRGFVQVGMPFKQGDVPIGLVPKIVVQGGSERLAIQFDQRTTWPDGSLKFCVCHFRDTDFSSLESRVYDLTAKSGTFNNDEVISLATMQAASDIKVTVNTLKDATPNTTVGSGTFTAAFNDVISTRLTKVASGLACDTWQGWIMYSDDTGGLEDNNLKGTFYVSAWNDGASGIDDFVYGCVTSQDWWAELDKDRRTYNAELYDGASLIETYTNVDHPYHSQWMTMRKVSDAQEGKRHWDTAVPTLNYKPNQAYWISTGLVPPLDTSVSTASAINYSTAWFPCKSISHRANIDSGGAYMGRGILPNVDCTAFLDQGSDKVRYSRVNAHAGLHIPYHLKSRRTRTRPSEGADEANTIIPFILDPLASGDYTFTSDGMPESQYAFNDGQRSTAGDRTSTTYKDDWAGKLGGNGVWTFGTGTSHAVNYSYYMYLLEGERYFMEATLDLAMNAAHAKVGDSSEAGGASEAIYHGRVGVPNTKWVPSVIGHTEERSTGWSAMLLGSGYAITPDGDVQTPCFKKYVEHCYDYIIEGTSYLPTNQSDWGLYNMDFKKHSPWQIGFQGLGLAHANNCIASDNTQATVNLVAKYAKSIFEFTADNIYPVSQYRTLITEKSDNWDATTNTFFAAGRIFAGRINSCTTSSATDRVDLATTIGSFAYTEDDAFFFASKTTSGSSATLPTDFSEGVIYYIRNILGTTVQLSATPGGSIISITSDDTGLSVAIELQDMQGRAVATTPPLLPGQDSYLEMVLSSLVGVAASTSGIISGSLLSDVQAFRANINITDWFTWSYA